jgi:hypothetical protein
MQATSDIDGSDGSDSEDVNETAPSKTRQSPEASAPGLLSSTMWGVLHGALWNLFALNIGKLLCGSNRYSKVYQIAYYEYDPLRSPFDNTIWTYGTDYALATITAGFAIWIILTSNRSSRDEHKRLARISALMLILYSISTGAGAIAHQNFLTVESRNSTNFRLLWTVCVGTVYIAPAAMGVIANECVRIFQPRSNCPPLLQSMPSLTDLYWVVYGAIGTIACALGYMSFQRPACDIFIAGGTQTPCTFYLMGFLYLVEHPGISKAMRIGGLTGFIMNANLMPLYPFLVLECGWSLASANTLLHAHLCVAWSLQGLTLQRIVKSLVEESVDAQPQGRLQTKKVQ